jgi:hypothetical protein
MSGLDGDRRHIQNTGIKRRPTDPGEMLREDFLSDYPYPIAIKQTSRANKES